MPAHATTFFTGIGDNDMGMFDTTGRGEAGEARSENTLKKAASG